MGQVSGQMDLLGTGASAPVFVAAPDDPWVSAAELEAVTNRKRRVIQVWFKRGCPHRQEVRNNQPCHLAQASVVLQWMRHNGMDPNVNTRVHGNGIAPKPRDQEQGTLVETIDELVAERCKELAGDVPYGSMIVQTRLMLDRLQRLISGNISTAEAKNLSGSLADVSREIRNLESARFDVERRNGEWLRRRSVEQFVAELCQVFVLELTALSQSMATAVQSELEASFAGAGIDSTVAARVATVAARRVVDEALSKRSTSIEEIVGKATRAGEDLS